MKRLVLFLPLILFCPALFAVSENEPVTVYLQLIQGTDQDNRPTSEAKQVGPKLSGRLHAVLKWKHYWELKRDSVTLRAGEKVRKRMTGEREIEITRLDAKQMEIRLFRLSKQTRLARQTVTTQFFIVGGDKGEDECWFIVVRQDKPPEIEKE